MCVGVYTENNRSGWFDAHHTLLSIMPLQVNQFTDSRIKFSLLITDIKHIIYPFKVLFLHKKKNRLLMCSLWLTLISVETTSNPPITKSRGAITMRGRREYPITPRTCPKETCSKEQKDSIKNVSYILQEQVRVMSDCYLDWVQKMTRCQLHLPHHREHEPAGRLSVIQISRWWWSKTQPAEFSFKIKNGEKLPPYCHPYQTIHIINHVCTKIR